MPAGAQVFNADGSTLIDLTTRLSRIVGIVYSAAGSSGSVTVDTTLGTPWAIPMLLAYPANAGPQITISPGGTISWAYNSLNPAYQSDAYIMYGIY